jgi:hypothetical protein
LSCFFSVISLLHTNTVVGPTTRVVEPIHELGKRSAVHARQGDHEQRHAISERNTGHRLTKPALRPVALYRITDPAAGNKPYLRWTRCAVNCKYDNQTHPAAVALTIEP